MKIMDKERKKNRAILCVLFGFGFFMVFSVIQ
jgi:predicted nucleic acid-binding Zn ribbon protein